MKVLHVAPGDSAGGSLIQALRLAGEDGENVLSCMDNFSCGPISSLVPADRSRWWGQFWEGYATPEAEGRLAEFWKRLDDWDGKLVLWFGLYSAAEVTLLHVLADRLRERPVFLADVTGHQYAYTRRLDGKPALGGPAEAASLVQPEGLRGLLGKERQATDRELTNLGARWQALVQENAPFRVVKNGVLISAPLDYFDEALLGAAKPTWQKLARVIGETLVSDAADLQVGDLLLLARAVALVEQGRLVANGDPWEMRSCEVRLPETRPTGRSAAFRDH